jgi:hypothetical protein
MKKFSAHELESLAKSVSRQYLENQIPLNDSVEKIARENDLNYNQTSRIIEEANTNVYIQLFNTASPGSKYIEFKTANLKEIWPKIKPAEDSIKTSDYALPPDSKMSHTTSKQIQEFNKFAEFEEESFEGPTSKSHAEVLKKLHDRALQERIKSAQFELEIVIDRVVNTLTKEARQSILGGDNTYAEISYAVKHALNETRYEKIATYILSQMPKIKNAEKEKVAGALDTSHEFYQNLKKLGQLIDTYVDVHKNPAESLEKVASALKLLFILPATAFSAAALAGAYRAGKVQGETSSSVSHDPSLYMKTT